MVGKKEVYMNVLISGQVCVLRLSELAAQNIRNACHELHKKAQSKFRTKRVRYKRKGKRKGKA